MRRMTAEPEGRPASLRMLYGAIALVAILGVGLAGGSVGRRVAEELRDRDHHTSRARRCEIERRTLRTAEEAYRAAHQEFGGIYATQETLVAEGWLDEQSPLYGVLLDDPPTRITVYAATEECS